MLRSILFFQLYEIVYYYYCIHITIWGCALCVLFFPRDSTYGGIFYYQNHICNREHCTLFALICYHITFSFADSLSHILREYTDRRVCVMDFHERWKIALHKLICFSRALTHTYFFSLPRRDSISYYEITLLDMVFCWCQNHIIAIVL